MWKPIEKKCLTCGKVYMPISHSQRYCCKKCQQEGLKLAQSKHALKRRESYLNQEIYTAKDIEQKAVALGKAVVRMAGMHKSSAEDVLVHLDCNVLNNRVDNLLFVSRSRAKDYILIPIVELLPRLRNAQMLVDEIRGAISDEAIDEARRRGGIVND